MARLGLATPAALARAVGAKAQTGARWFSGDRGFGAANAVKLAALFGVPVEQLLAPDPAGGPGEAAEATASQPGTAAWDAASGGVESAAVRVDATGGRIVEYSVVAYRVTLRTTRWNGGPYRAAGPVITVPRRVLADCAEDASRLVCVEITDDSMVDDRPLPPGATHGRVTLRRGDYALFRPAPAAAIPSGAIVCAILPAAAHRDGACLVRRLEWLEEHRMALIPTLPVPGSGGRQEFHRDDVELVGTLVAVVHPVGDVGLPAPQDARRHGSDEQSAGS